MISPKIVFFDIDDTLYTHHEPKHVPESAKKALRLLKHRGILTAIATGRTIAVLPPAIQDIIAECSIDMIVSINGQYIQYQNKPLAHFPLDKSQVQYVSQQLCQQNIAHALVNHSGVFSVLENIHSHTAMSALNIPYQPAPQAYQQHDIYQILAFYPTQTDTIVQTILPQAWKIIRWHEHGTDWLDKNGSKARGIRAALDKLGLTMNDAIAFGDALNDIEMLQSVGLGVAMGNACEQVKAVADYVCPSITEDGIYRGLIELGVIEEASSSKK